MAVDRSPVAPPGAAEANPHPLPQPAKPSEEHRTRAVDFFERRTPIVYQNRNGPCPLFSICNFLLLKGLISLPDAGKVSQEDLISLVANLLMDTNIVREDQDEEYARNRERNVDDAIALLPRLATVIDMNPKFRRIDEFEFTTELAVFDCLDIPLYHGWIVDPKDTETATAIGSKSYHALVAGVAEFKSGKPTEENKHVEEETVDFAAATTAALKIPSPSVSRGRSFDEHTLSNSAHEPQKGRGDLLEEAEVARVLKLSKDESGVTFDISQSHTSSTKVTPQSQGEAAEQADQIEENSPSVDDNAIKWDLIDNFLKSNPTQLTAHGLLCLRKDVKESELCVLFCDSHFNTMFKYNGMIYLLANDEDLIDKTELVWQRLDEVNGAGVFVTSKFTLLKPETPRKRAQDYNAQSDNASGRRACKIPSADPMDTLNEKNLSRAPGSKPLTFDASLVNDYIVNKKWEDLDDYLGNFVAAILKSTPDEVVMMHPGLFLIPRMEKLLDMLSVENFHEADLFYQRSLELLRGCQGKFAAFGLVHDIDLLGTGVKARSKPASRCSAEEIGTSILDYIHLHFPSAIHRDDGPNDGVWQFAMRLHKLDKKGRRASNGFRCFVCGWVAKAHYSGSHLRSHLLQSSQCKSCLKVTEDVLDRLRAADETKDLPTLEKFKESFSKKRKLTSNNIVTWVSGRNNSTGPITSSSGSRENKRPSTCGTSHSIETPTSQIRQLPVSPAQMQSDKIHLLSDKLGKEASAILDRLRQSPCVFPGDRFSITRSVGRLLKVCVHLKTHAWFHASQPAPEELSKILGLLREASVDVFGCISAADILEEEVCLFLIDRATVVFELVLLGI